MNILITGASSGIGKALSIYYAKNKLAKTLFISGRNKERLAETKSLCENFGVTVYEKVLDVTKKQDMNEWILNCEKISPLNLIIANAGVATLEETPDNIFNTFNTNIFGVLNTITPTIEIFKKASRKQKQIAIISSIAGYHGLPACPSYSASKACVKAYGESLRVSLRAYNIKVNVICPGFVRSCITDKNTCPMPFFMETDNAAKIIADRLNKNIGLISFPWQMRFTSWLISILPNCISDFIYSKLPHKV